MWLGNRMLICDLPTKLVPRTNPGFLFRFAENILFKSFEYSLKSVDFFVVDKMDFNTKFAAVW